MCVCVCGVFVFMLFSSPAEELSFGSVDTERKSLIILSNVAKNKVAFKVSVMLLFWVCDTPNVELTDDGAMVPGSHLVTAVLSLQVRTTAPEKYRVKPSSSCCEPGASVDIVVSLHGGTTFSPSPRVFLETSGTPRGNVWLKRHRL